ncbi:UDP-glucose 4-epimerase family protein [Deefgea salmonis]|uniref:SDR family oxidoreductase n=1 Tax=Deefgea salmonis TaxID=2875502 RepID=A0ABS8BK67_9NEIS|nr:SDR family oxidoreductase [Deefgea salmonis]MCB5196112.1 SDR family oxidoreductase [Deefgea salmonis]
MKNKLLITGANGFVGRTLCAFLSHEEIQFRAVARRDNNDAVSVGSIDGNTNWSDALLDIDVIVHTAARAHILNDVCLDPLAEFRKVNVEGTLNLARQALAVGVRRFIFISSIGVNGNQSSQPFLESDQPNPIEPYALSKLEAEIGLRDLLAGSSMELVIIRPPLVYGAKAPGNFGRLIQAVAKGIPLPLGAIHNQRSLVALDNLVDLIFTCIDHPAAANQIFLAGDGEDLSTTELFQKMANALNVPSRLIPVPMWMLQSGARILGKSDMAQRLCGSLQVDISKARDVLGWTPPLSVDEALRKTARGFLDLQKVAKL